MFLRSRTLTAISTLLLAAALASGAVAGEHRYRIHRIRHVAVRHVSIRHVTINNNQRIINRSVIVNAGRSGQRHLLPAEANTYSGDVAVYSRDDVGTWSYGTMSARADLVTTGSTLKIIDLTNGKNDCSMEQGVCVIRP